MSLEKHGKGSGRDLYWMRHFYNRVLPMRNPSLLHCFLVMRATGGWPLSLGAHQRSQSLSSHAARDPSPGQQSQRLGVLPLPWEPCLVLLTTLPDSMNSLCSQTVSVLLGCGSCLKMSRNPDRTVTPWSVDAFLLWPEGPSHQKDNTQLFSASETGVFYLELSPRWSSHWNLCEPCGWEDGGSHYKPKKASPQTRDKWPCIN